MKKNIEIKITDIWNKEKGNGLKKFILLHSEKQSKDRKLKNELLSIQYQIEDYIGSDSYANKLSISDFVKMYLKTLNITQKTLAGLFEIKDSNLHKYLVGERKLNASIVLKLSSFSHTKPEHWFGVELKNEIIEIAKEKGNIKKYRKYDYRNLFTASDN